MIYHSVTPCRRYGKCRGEPFLRRRGTDEPVDQTPRRYYETDDQYLEGQCMSAAAWEKWKRENPDGARRGRSPWFELVDRELLDINSLIQSEANEDFRLGLQRLRSRVSVSERAGSNIKASARANRPRNKNGLESSSRRDEGKQKLFKLCENVAAPQTAAVTRGLPPSYHSHSPVLEARSQDQQHSSTDNVGTETQVALDLLRNISPPSNMTGILDANTQQRQRSRLHLERENTPSRSPIGVRNFAIEATNGESVGSPRRPRQQRIAAPAAASPKTALYIGGGGTKAPTYISPSKFFAEHGEEHGVERPPAYATVAPSIPAAAQFIPRNKMDEDAYDMQMEGRRDQFGARQTQVPPSIPEAQNGEHYNTGLNCRSAGESIIRYTPPDSIGVIS
ncbi:hypothetical protein L207DRAFT_630566 [Hyaloscypha variabilis F]|uniref:Uncharacterized protein n=1 Tax=Hyaloscypha variabilis (strain UAMH 11265 / GT02V1 / F) TaxID=1149755 RepID=A0A2J6S0A1_HYAVF|nr:hypothetical protein L207DRAFT_630566 [Hyaloscypha variabilis F]